jgi:hypothetical protein
VFEARILALLIPILFGCSTTSTLRAVEPGIPPSLQPTHADERGRDLLGAVEALDYPYCNVMITEARGEDRGHVSEDGCSLYYNPSQGGPPRLEELLQEALSVRRQNIKRDPDRYGRPRQ